MFVKENHNEYILAVKDVNSAHLYVYVYEQMLFCT